MIRREFITLLGGAAAAWPLAARAQQSGAMRRTGMLINGAETDLETKARLAGFRQALERLGWSEGHNLRIDYRFAPASLERAQVFAQELVALQPDVILAHSTMFAVAVQQVTRTIPIVFTNVSDPIGAGLVASLARPGGNLTGLMLFEQGIAGKWLSMLKEVEPTIRVVTMIANPKTMPYDYYLRLAQNFAPRLAIELVHSPVENATDIERVLERFSQKTNGGLFVPPDPTTTLYRTLIIALAAGHRLPAVYAARTFVAEGGLMYYGIDIVDHFRQAATYVDRSQSWRPISFAVE